MIPLIWGIHWKRASACTTHFPPVFRRLVATGIDIRPALLHTYEPSVPVLPRVFSASSPLRPPTTSSFVFTMQLLPTFVTIFAAVASMVSAKPVVLVRDAVVGTPVSDIVVAPGFSNPTGGEIYQSGSAQVAQWETSTIPAEAQNYTGVLYLGYNTPDSPSENLDISMRNLLSYLAPHHAYVHGQHTRLRTASS
jgi:hypothetical protein